VPDGAYAGQCCGDQNDSDYGSMYSNGMWDWEAANGNPTHINSLNIDYLCDSAEGGPSTGTVKLYNSTNYTGEIAFTLDSINWNGTAVAGRFDAVSTGPNWLYCDRAVTANPTLWQVPGLLAVGPNGATVSMGTNSFIRGITKNGVTHQYMCYNNTADQVSSIVECCGNTTCFEQNAIHGGLTSAAGEFSYGTPTYCCHNDGTWSVGACPVPPLPELCNVPGDEDGNFECDWDSSTCGHGDPICRPSIIGATISNLNPCMGSKVEALCTPSVGGINSVLASFDNKYCSFKYWNNDSFGKPVTAVFDCDAPVVLGEKWLNCSINESRSYKSGSDMLTNASMKACVEDCWWNTGDEDGDGECNWDNTNCLHGDNDCAVGVNNIDVFRNSSCPGSTIFVGCNASMPNISSVVAIINNRFCTWDHWTGNWAWFNCTSDLVINTPQTLMCGINSSISYPTGANQSRIVQTGACLPAQIGTCFGGFVCNQTCGLSSGNEITYQTCTDGLDNDCDSDIDTDDSSCFGDLNGSVWDGDNIGWIITMASVKASPTVPASVVRKPAEVLNQSRYDGYYWLNKVFVGTHEIGARKDGYVDDVRNVTVYSGQNTSQDFYLGKGANCHVDCTDSKSICNTACQNWKVNGTASNDSCVFQNLNACAGKPKGYRAFIIDINNTMHDITCCEGPEITYPATKANVSSNVDNLIDWEMPVKMNKRLYIMHILVWTNTTR
jgi:hypothetical protein